MTEILSRGNRGEAEFFAAALPKKLRYESKPDPFSRTYPADLQAADGIAACTWAQLTGIAEFVHNYVTGPNKQTDEVDAIARALWLWQQEKRNELNLSIEQSTDSNDQHDLC